MYNKICSQLKDARLKLGLSQRNLGKLLKITGAQVGYLENGDRDLSLKMFLKFCRLLKIHPVLCMHRAIKNNHCYFLTSRQGKQYIEFMKGLWKITKNK